MTPQGRKRRAPQQVASVPPAVRAEYVEATKAAGGEVSTDGPWRRDPVEGVDSTQLRT
jgi:hypothetical protein